MARVLRRRPTSATDGEIYMGEGPRSCISTGIELVELEDPRRIEGLQSDMSIGVIPSMLEDTYLIKVIGVNPSTVKSGQMSSWFGEERRKLYELCDLKDGWDSYSAPSPDAPALQMAEDFLDHLAECNIRPIHMGPCVAGGVGFTFIGAEQEYVVEFENDGRIVTSIIESDTEPISVVTNERSTEVEALDVIIEELRRVDGV